VNFLRGKELQHIGMDWFREHCAPPRPSLLPSWVSEKWPLDRWDFGPVTWAMKSNPKINFLLQMSITSDTCVISLRVKVDPASQDLPGLHSHQPASLTVCLAHTELLPSQSYMSSNLLPPGNSPQTPNHSQSLSLDAPWGFYRPPSAHFLAHVVCLSSYQVFYILQQWSPLRCLCPLGISVLASYSGCPKLQGE
jgi:hypothetical protein